MGEIKMSEYKYTGEKRTFEYYSGKSTRGSETGDFVIKKGSVDYNEIMPSSFLFVTSLSGDNCFNCTKQLRSTQGFYFAAYEESMLNEKLISQSCTGKYIYKIDANKMFQDEYKFYEFNDMGNYDENIIMCCTKKIPSEYVIEFVSSINDFNKVHGRND